MSRVQYHLLVAGDVVIDHHIYRGKSAHPVACGEGTRIIPQVGGAGQTARLLDKLCETQTLIDVHDGTPGRPLELARTPDAYHAFATWAPFSPTKKDKKKKPKIWRVNETFGFGTVEPLDASPNRKDKSAEPPSFNVVVIDEGGCGFRSEKEDWPACLHDKAAGNEPWIVLKMSSPVCRGDLWTHLLQESYLDRLIVIVAADDLRRSGASITKGLSWEKSVQELLSDLDFHADFPALPIHRQIL